MRYTEDESPDVVLGQLYAAEPKWEPHPHAGKKAEAAGLSRQHETRAAFEQRHAAWERAVERERARGSANPG